MKNTTWAAVLFLLLVMTSPLVFGQEQKLGITQILPTASQLGEGWLSNRVVLLVDPLSSPPEVADPRDVRDPEASLRERHAMLLRENVQAHGFARYYHGPSQYAVFVTRYETQAGLEAAWNRSLKETDRIPGIASGIGESAFLHKSGGLHNDVSFRRGNNLITVEGSLNLGLDNLKHLASALDGNLLKAQSESKWQPYVLKTMGGLVTITNPPRSNPVHISFVRWHSDKTGGDLAVYRLTNTETHTIMIWDARVQVRASNSSTNRSGAEKVGDSYVRTNPLSPAPEHSGWETVHEDWPPKGASSNVAPGATDEFYVNRPSRTPWRTCIVYSKDWTDSGRAYSGDYEVISEEMKE